MELTVRFAACC